MRTLHKAQLAVVGLPGCGKTTLGNELGRVLDLGCMHTDQFAEYPWAEQADLAVYYSPVRGIIEGVTVARMFRRGFNPECTLYITGGDYTKPPNKSLYTLIHRGLDEYTGRVITLPYRPSAVKALQMLGGARD